MELAERLLEEHDLDAWIAQRTIYRAVFYSDCLGYWVSYSITRFNVCRTKHKPTRLDALREAKKMIEREAK